jgi:hypothetical protein
MAQDEVVSRRGTSWALRVYGAIPLAPALTGVALALLLIAVLLASEVALGRLMASPSDLRVAIVHCLVVAYFPTAYVYVILWSRRTVSELRPALDCSEADFVEHANRVGRYSWWTLAVVGILSVAAVVRLTIDTTPAPTDPWAWGQLLPEVLWHRVLGAIGGWSAGCFLYAVIVESNRLSLLARRLRQPDLFDLRPLMPFTRQALGNALLILGSVSVYSFFLVEAIFLTMVTSMWIGAITLATVTFMLPILGLHRILRDARQTELDWCLDALRRARAGLKNGASDPQRLPMAEIVAYKQLVEGVREWPFDSSTLVRFAIYLLIPLASWSGGAVVERMIDSLLD